MDIMAQDLIHPRPKAGVRIALPNSTTTKKFPVKDLCAMIKKNTDRLNLNVDGASLSYHPGTEVQVRDFHDCEVVSLTEGLLENEEGILGLPAKVCLAVVLSYAFLDFCGKPWFPGGWNRKSLQFMQKNETVFLRPFLVTDMAPKQTRFKSGKPLASIRATKLLHHGILLMEIFQQDAFNLSPEPGGKGKSLKDSAEERLKSIKWDVSERFGKAVEECIKGELVDSSMLSSAMAPEGTVGQSKSISTCTPEVSDEDFARLFCERILALLEADFKSHWQEKDPDQVITTLKLSCAKRQQLNLSHNPRTTASKALMSRRPAIPNRPSHSQPRPLYQSKLTPRSTPLGTQRHTQASSSSNPFSSQHTGIKFFDAEDSPDIAQ